MYVFLSCGLARLTIYEQANKEQRARLYDAVKGHTVTLRGYVPCLFYEIDC
jgi:hypothetical protein